MANLNKELEILLKNHLKNGFIDSEKILKDPKEWISLYENYENPASEKPYDDLKGIKVEDVNPYFLKYNIKRFWFKDDESQIVVENDEIVAFQDGVRIILKAGSFIDGGEVDYVEDISKEKYKEFVYLYLPKKIQKPSENFYLHTHGDYLLRNYYQPIIRFYFSLEPKSIEEVNNLIKEIRDYFNSRKIPFQLKTPYTLDNFNRCDTLVLYVAQSHYFYVWEFIKGLKKYGGQGNKKILRNQLPLFVKELYKGVGLAEDTFFTEDSFGQQRCKLIIEAITTLSKDENKVSIQNIIEYLEKQGYNVDEFYRNPYTGFEYKFNEPVVEPLPFKLEWRYKKYLYGKFNDVARDYALELMERAIWLDDTDFTWLSYEEKGSYKPLNEKEKQEIFWFFDRLIKIKENRDFFPENVLRIIEQKVNGFETDPNFLKKVNVWKSSTKTLYNKYKKIILLRTHDFSIEAVKSHWKKLVETPLSKKEKMLIDGAISFIKSFDIADISDDEIYNIGRQDFERNDMLEIAKRINKKYLNINYPIRNDFGNYEYCPTSKGKLQVAMIMLYIYCPSLYD